MAVTITNIEYVPFNAWSVEKNISSHISNIFTSPYGQSLAEPGKITITLSNGVYKNEACNEIIDISSISFLDHYFNTHPRHRPHSCWHDRHAHAAQRYKSAKNLLINKYCQYFYLLHRDFSRPTILRNFSNTNYHRARRRRYGSCPWSAGNPG